ncbi:MAG TPA: sigma-70 family RNA polymerase sigma factor [Myxococcales bacterium]
MTDEILAERTRQGSSTAFAALVARHCHTVYRIARNICASAGDAEDVTRQTFLSAYHGADSRPSGSSVRTWLCGLAMNKATVQRQRAWRSQAVSLEAFLPRFDAEGGLEPPGGEWPELGSARVEQMNVAGYLRKALDDMDEGVRAAFVLCDLAQLPAEDAAAIVKASPEIVRGRVHRARLMLRGLFDRLWSL